MGVSEGEKKPVFSPAGAYTGRGSSLHCSAHAQISGQQATQ